MKAVINLDVPDWQIGQNVTVYFPDTMVKHGVCGKDEIVRCSDCKYSMAAVFDHGRYCGLHKKTRADGWYCADGERREET